MSAADIEAVLTARVPGYLPGWAPVPGGAGAALLAIAARFSAVSAERLDRAPEKNKLAFLDLLGISLLPAQAARAPIAFALRPGLGDSRAPAGTQIGATVAGLAGPMIFETERDIALASAPLAEVATVLPGADAWAAHTADYTGHRPFTLFDPTVPVGHELYLAHDVHFALDGHSEVEVRLDLATPGGRTIDVRWEYWDGTDWRPFAPFVASTRATEADSIDGTSGFTRSGTVLLRVEGAVTARRTVNGVDSYWIRARTASPLTPDFAPHLPQLDRVLISTVVAPPIGALAIRPELSADGSLPRTRSLDLRAESVIAISPEISSASATLTPIGGAADERQPLTQSLTNGLASFGPATAKTRGAYSLKVDVPGFTSLFARIELDETAGGSEAIVHYRPGDRRPDRGATSTLPLDLSRPFYPFGQSPQPGSCFYLAADDAFGKPGASVRLAFEASADGLPSGTDTNPTLDAQYFDGETWRGLTVPDLDDLDLTAGGSITFEVPADGCSAVEVNSVLARWIRLRIVDGVFSTEVTTTVGTTTFTSVQLRSPAVKQVRLSYYYRSPREAPTACHTCNDFVWTDRSAGLAARGAPFAPFTVVQDTTPALYLGFDGPLPTDVLSVYADLAEVVGEESGPALVWECADGEQWVPMTVEDETAGLALPGTIRIAYPGVAELPSERGMQLSADSVRSTDPLGAGRLRPGDRVTVGDDGGSEYAVVAAVDAGEVRFTRPTSTIYPRATVTRCGPARFGTPRAAWIRARLRTDGDPRATRVEGIHPNTAWAAQAQTRTDEVLGTSDGNPAQSVAVRYPPVLPGQVLEVLELSGARAAVDLAGLSDDVIAHGGTAEDLRVVRDPVSGAVREVWVRWAEQRNLFFSGPADRHYALERSSGLVYFGDARHGRIPPSATDGIRMRSYRSGGGSAGNVPAGAIDQLLSGIPAASVGNVRAAEGGADTESRPSVLARGPASVAARSQAVTLADYEVLAHEASPAVAVARALPATDPTGRPRPGFVRVIVMPDSVEPRPMPSFGLRRQVEQYVRRRCPASMTGQVFAVAPDYRPVGVRAEIVPERVDDAGPVVDAVTAAVRTFLHPLHGGPDGQGWAFGRDVHLSDLARVIGGVAGVDAVRGLELLVDGAPHGQLVEVPAGHIVVAGPVTVRLAGGG